MSKGLSGNNTETRAPGSNGPVMYPTGQQTGATDGTVRGNLSVQGAPAATVGRGAQGVTSARELESLLSVGFGEHAGEIARRVVAAPAAASTNRAPRLGARPSAAPLPADLLPSRTQRSTKDQLALLLSVTFGADAERLAENLVVTTPAPTGVAPVSVPAVAAVPASVENRATASVAAPQTVGAIQLSQPSAPKSLPGVEIDLSGKSSVVVAAPKAQTVVPAAPVAAAPAVVSVVAAPVATQPVPALGAIQLSQPSVAKSLPGADINLGGPVTAPVVRPATPVAAPAVTAPAMTAPAMTAPAMTAPAMTALAMTAPAAARETVGETALHCAATPARKPQGDGVHDGGSAPAGRDGSGHDGARAKASRPAAKPETTPARGAVRQDVAVTDDSSGLPWAIFLTAVTGLALYGWMMRDSGYLTPESDIGYYLGIVGCTIMLSLLLYPMRKKLAFMRNMGQVKYWFQTHMVAGILGPLAIVFHANFKTGATNSNVALFTMLTVAGSGLLGRFMYTKIHHGLYGRRATMAEMRGGLSTAHGALEAELSLDATVVERLDRLEKWLITPTGFFGRLWRYLTVGVRTRWIAFRIRRPVRVALNARAVEAGWDRATLKSHRRTLHSHLMAYFHSVHHVAAFGVYERIFGLWHLLHFPLFLMMAFAAIIHVLAVHMY